MTSESLRKRMRGWAVFFMVVSGITTVAGAFMLANNGYTDDALGRLIVGPFLILCALTVWNGSRTGAMLLAGLLAADVFYVLPQSADPAAVGPFIRALFYLGASLYLVWTTWRYVRSRQWNDEPVEGSNLIRWGGVSVGGLAALFILIGLAVPEDMGSPVPATIVAGADIPEDQLAWLREEELLAEEETPLLFYSEGVFSIEEGGQVLSKNYITSWWQDDEELAMNWARLGEVCSADQVSNEDAPGHHVFRITTAEQDWFDLWLPPFDNADERFMARLKYLNRTRMIPEVEESCEAGEPIDWEAVAEGRGFPREVVPGGEIETHIRDWLVERQYLLEEEEPLEFYTYASLDIAEGGGLLTDLYVGGWYQHEGELSAWWAEIGKICIVTASDKADDYQNYDLEALDTDGGFTMSLQTRNDGDKRFMARLQELNAAAKTAEYETACLERAAKTESADAG